MVVLKVVILVQPNHVFYLCFMSMSWQSQGRFNLTCKCPLVCRKKEFALNLQCSDSKSSSFRSVLDQTLSQSAFQQFKKGNIRKQRIKQQNRKQLEANKNTIYMIWEVKIKRNLNKKETSDWTESKGRCWVFNCNLKSSSTGRQRLRATTAKAPLV